MLIQVLQALAGHGCRRSVRTARTAAATMLDPAYSSRKIGFKLAGVELQQSPECKGAVTACNSQLFSSHYKWNRGIREGTEGAS